MGPAEVDGLLLGGAAQQAVDEAGGVAVATSDPVDDVEFARRRLVSLAVDPGDRAPGVTVGGVHLAEGRGDDLHVGEFLHGLIDHREERGRIEFGGRLDVLALDAEPLLEVFLVADDDVDILHDAAEHIERLGVAAPDVPELGAVIEIERRDGTGRLRGAHGLDDEFTGRLGEGGEDAAAVEPTDARREDFLPVEVARLELAGGLVAAVVEHHRGAHALAAVAVHGGHVRAAHTVVLELLVVRLHAHRPNTFGDQVTDRVVDHRADDAGVEPEAVGEVGGDVELATADMDVAVVRLAERDDTRVKAVDESAQRQHVDGAFGAEVEAVFHGGGERESGADRFAMTKAADRPKGDGFGRPKRGSIAYPDSAGGG